MKSMIDSSTISLLEKVAIFGERRHEVLAGNIANINTPNYRMRDLPVEQFRAALQEAIETPHSPSASSESTAAHTARSIDDLFPEHLFQAVKATPHNITFQDANNRSVEHQAMELTKNNMLQNFAIELMRSQFGMLQTVITERP